MNRHERERLFFLGSAFAIGPALVFLPAFTQLVFHPTAPHAHVWAALLFPVLAAVEVFGVIQLVQSCVQRPFSLLTMLSFGALLVLLVIAAYTGIFLAALVERM